MGVSVRIQGDEAIATALRTLNPRLKARTTAAVHQFAVLLTERIQTAASGRPGPNIVSGQLYGSILIDHTLGDVDGWGAATVYTATVYAPRLEFGFYGTDSLGRNYNQPPYPFFGRAVEGSVGEFASVMQRAVNGL